MRVVRLLMALLALAALSGFVNASSSVALTADTRCLSLRPYLEVLEDPSGSLTLDQVQQPETARRFAPVKGSSDLNFGYSASTYWLRLEVSAEADAARLVKEADEASKALQERRQQDAVASANSILAKAREAAELEKEQLMSQLKREFGRMVADATSRVTGKVLNSDDQARLNQETAAQVSA